MTCKDAINSDTNSDEKLYLLNESTRYNKCFRFNLEGTAINQLRVDLEFSFNSNYNNSWNP